MIVHQRNHRTEIIKRMEVNKRNRQRKNRQNKNHQSKISNLAKKKKRAKLSMNKETLKIQQKDNEKREGEIVN